MLSEQKNELSCFNLHFKLNTHFKYGYKFVLWCWKIFVMIHKCWSHAEILWIRVSIIHAKEKTKRRANLPLVFFGSTEEGKSQKLKKAIIVGKYITTILLFSRYLFLQFIRGGKSSMTRGCTIPQRIMTCPSENCSTLWLENDTGNIKPYLILRHFP